MKVISCETERVELPLVEGYRITGHSIDVATNFLLRVTTDDGLSGLGCAAPSNDVTGESDDMCNAAMDGPLQDLVMGMNVSADPSSIADAAFGLAADCPAARAAYDMALWDIAAKKAIRMRNRSA